MEENRDKLLPVCLYQDNGKRKFSKENRNDRTENLRTSGRKEKHSKSINMDTHSKLTLSS